LLKRSWRSWPHASYWYQCKNNCQSYLERVVLMHLIGRLFIGRAFFRKPEESDYLSPLRIFSFYLQGILNDMLLMLDVSSLVGHFMSFSCMPICCLRRTFHQHSGLQYYGWSFYNSVFSLCSSWCIEIPWFISSQDNKSLSLNNFY